MQDFKPTNTRHIFQDIKGQAILTSTVMLSLFTATGLVSTTDAHQIIVAATTSSAQAFVQEVPKIMHYHYDMASTAWSSATKSITNSTSTAYYNAGPTAQPGSQVQLDLVIAPLAQTAFLTTNTPLLSTSDYFNQTQDSPFAQYGQTQKQQARSSSNLEVATLQEINAFLNLEHSKYTFVDNKYFIQNAKTKLPKYQADFKAAAKAVNLDWKLLASIAYQESVWEPNAVSPTGVKGMMMLTRITAKEMGVADRTNVQQSIFGGAGYFRKLVDRIPAEVTGPDRVLMALAAYNMGYGHLISARALTQKQGADATSWFEVKKRIPLLQEKKYYQHSRYGYARGARQALHYVQQIQKHYDMLLMLTTQSAIAQGNASRATADGFALARYSAE